MTEFINEFGKTNFIILISIIAVVLLALLIILLIEKKANKEDLEIEEYDDINYDNNHISIENNEQTEDDKVVYVDHEPTKQEAKEKLEEVTRKLIEDDLNIIKQQKQSPKEYQHLDNDLINHTSFEEEQEEKSIISYDELVEAANSYEENDKYMLDEEKSAITIEELYQKHEQEQNDFGKKIDNPIFEDDNKRFRNSDVISPVFGIYTKEQKRQDNVLKEINKTEPAKDLEEEIRKTEEFLEQLKQLKSKLE